MVKVDSPIMIPAGAVMEKSRHRRGFRKMMFAHLPRALGNAAIRTPSDKPSNSWWNDTAVRRETEENIYE